MITKNYFLIFIIGLLSIFPSLALTAISVSRNPTLENYKLANLETKLYTYPILYGIVNILGVLIVTQLLSEQFHNYFILGIIMGVIYPTINNIGDYTQKMYGITNILDLYIGSQLLYIPFYGIVVSYIVNRICE